MNDPRTPGTDLVLLTTCRSVRSTHAVTVTLERENLRCEVRSAQPWDVADSAFEVLVARADLDRAMQVVDGSGPLLPRGVSRPVREVPPARAAWKTAVAWVAAADGVAVLLVLLSVTNPSSLGQVFGTWLVAAAIALVGAVVVPTAILLGAAVQRRSTRLAAGALGFLLVVGAVNATPVVWAVLA